MEYLDYLGYVLIGIWLVALTPIAFLIAAMIEGRGDLAKKETKA